MKEFTIYLAGAMSGITFEEANIWRRSFTKSMKYIYSDIKVNCINPNDYYNFKEIIYDSEREVMEFDLYKVRHSDLIVVNFEHPVSLGTMAELTIAYEHKIPVIGLNINHEKLHPWQVEMCNKIFDNENELTHYICDYYLK